MVCSREHQSVHRATDDEGAFDEETFQSVQKNISSSQLIDEDEPFNYQVVASDPDGDPLNFYGSALPNWVSVSPSGLFPIIMTLAFIQ